MSQVGRGLETTLCAIITAAGTDRMRLPSEDGIGGEGGKARAGNGKREEARVSWEGGGGTVDWVPRCDIYLPAASRPVRGTARWSERDRGQTERDAMPRSEWSDGLNEPSQVHEITRRLAVGFGSPPSHG